jgi:KaiC/GvpD/RAD55 family RecA-like ATPase
LEQRAQIGHAIGAVDRPAADFLDLPWPRLAQVVGGIAPGSQVYVAANTGSGKTSWMLSAVCRWLSTGRRLYYAGLESRPEILRTQLACRVLGYDAGYVLSGDFNRDPNANRIRAELKIELERQRDSDVYQRIYFSPHEALSGRIMRSILHEARDFAAEAVIIDHIDHGAAPANGNHYAESRATVAVAHELTNKFALRTFIATQTNWGGASSDRLRNHKPLRLEHLFMGGHKAQIADVVLGLYRPMRADTTRQQRVDVEKGRAEVATILARNTIAVNVMKHRLYGERAGKIVALGFHRGDVTDAPLIDLNVMRG